MTFQPNFISFALEAEAALTQEEGRSSLLGITMLQHADCYPAAVPEQRG